MSQLTVTMIESLLSKVKKQTNYLLISRKMFFKTRIYLFFLFISTEDQSVEEDTPHFNVEITPPQTSEPEGATCLPDVVP